MEFALSVVKVFIGSFLLFTAARVTHASVGQRSPWGWVALVGTLAFANMLVHRWFGSTINPPFFTAVCFGLSLAGLSPKDAPTLSTWHKRAIYAVVAGTALGWTAYAETAAT